MVHDIATEQRETSERLTPVDMFKHGQLVKTENDPSSTTLRNDLGESNIDAADLELPPKRKYVYVKGFEIFK